MDREEWQHSCQGKKVADGCCGRTIEAKPVSGQTCPIEPTDGLALSQQKEGTDEWRCQVIGISNRRRLNRFERDAGCFRNTVCRSRQSIPE